MNEAHIHDYKKIKLVKITGKLNQAYQGVPGDRAFLVRECECGESKAFDYGTTPDMKELLTKLTKKETSNV